MRSFYNWLVLLGLTLAVTPRVGFAPATVHLKVKSDVGDTIVVLLDSPNFYRRTDYPNDGATHFFDWRDMPAGEHEVHVFAYDHGRVVAHERARLELQSNQ